MFDILWRRIAVARLAAQQDRDRSARNCERRHAVANRGGNDCVEETSKQSREMLLIQNKLVREPEAIGHIRELLGMRVGHKSVTTRSQKA